MVTVQGDATRDGTVDYCDLLALIGGVGLGESSWGEGDFDGSGCVDASDYIALKTHFRQSVPGPIAGGSASSGLLSDEGLLNGEGPQEQETVQAEESAPPQALAEPVATHPKEELILVSVDVLADTPLTPNSPVVDRPIRQTLLSVVADSNVPLRKAAMAAAWASATQNPQTADVLVAASPVMAATPSVRSASGRVLLTDPGKLRALLPPKLPLMTLGRITSEDVTVLRRLDQQEEPAMFEDCIATSLPNVLAIADLYVIGVPDHGRRAPGSRVE
jgi:hypothetical protein